MSFTLAPTRRAAAIAAIAFATGLAGCGSDASAATSNGAATAGRQAGANGTTPQGTTPPPDGQALTTPGRNGSSVRSAS